MIIGKLRVFSINTQNTICQKFSLLDLKIQAISFANEVTQVK